MIRGFSDDGLAYDDEDDENDENNWRNDYPDEEEYEYFADGGIYLSIT